MTTASTNIQTRRRFSSLLAWAVAMEVPGGQRAGGGLQGYSTTPVTSALAGGPGEPYSLARTKIAIDGSTTAASAITTTMDTNQ